MRQNGLSTQCIQTRTANSRNDMTLAQLCLKVNTKMGGINNYINRDRITRSVSVHALNSFFFYHTSNTTCTVLLWYAR